MNLTPLNKLFQIFVRKKWIEQDIYTTVLENFGYLLLNLTEPQRELMLELAENYNWISYNEYQTKLTNVLKKVEEEKLKGCERVIVFPIMKPEDQDKVKSGHATLYMIRGLKPFIRQYDNIEIVEFIKYDDISEANFKPKKTDLIFLVDDYLGSGETVEITLEKILSNRNIDLESLNIITVASQNDTINFVKNKGISIYFDHVQIKGITDYNDPKTASEKINVMLEIEKLVKGSNFFSLGYNQSEALITLIRTPDNTFPIFWKEHKKNGEIFKAPFQRY